MKCLICEKEIRFDPNGPGNDEEGLLPNLEGGTIEINFGYGSKFDMLPDHMYIRDIRIQSAICDNCFEKKQSLTRKVEVIKKQKYKIIYPYGNEYDISGRNGIGV